MADGIPVCYNIGVKKSNELTQKILAYIHSKGGYAWRASSTGIFDPRRGVFRSAPKKGVSDILACYRGRLIAVEVKIGRDTLSPEQEGFLLSVNHAGGYAFVAHTFEEFVNQFTFVDKPA